LHGSHKVVGTKILHGIGKESHNRELGDCNTDQKFLSELLKYILIKKYGNVIDLQLSKKECMRCQLTIHKSSMRLDG